MNTGDPGDSVWPEGEDDDPSNPHWLVDEVDGRLNRVGLPTYTELAKLLRALQEEPSNATTEASLNDALRVITQRVELGR